MSQSWTSRSQTRNPWSRLGLETIWEGLGLGLSLGLKSKVSVSDRKVSFASLLHSETAGRYPWQGSTRWQIGGHGYWSQSGWPLVSVNVSNIFIIYSDYELFKKVCSWSHSFYHLLPPYHTTDLRLHGHPFQLPRFDTDLHKKFFIVWSLYEYIK